MSRRTASRFCTRSVSTWLTGLRRFGTRELASSRDASRDNRLRLVSIEHLESRQLLSATTVELASQAAFYSESAGGSIDVTRNTVSADGRYVIFASNAPNLVSGLTITGQNIYRRDRLTGDTQLVTINAAETGSGNYNYSSYQASISADGMVVAFISQSSDLVANDTNGTLDVFIRDFSDPANPVTRLVSVNAAGDGSGNYYSYQPVLSADGKVVAFSSYASDLVNNDSNGTSQDVFVRDFSDSANPVTRLVSVNSAGSGSGSGYSQNPVISADGRVVAFVSYANNLGATDQNGQQDVYLRDFSDPASPVTRLVSVNSAGSGSGNNNSYQPAISADGKAVAFTSSANNLVANDTNGSYEDVFVRDFSDPAGPVTRLASMNLAGTGSSNGYSYQPVMSGDGKVIAFSSSANDLVANDTNGTTDVFVRDFSDPANPVTRLVSVNSAGNGSGSSYSQNPAISTDGKLVAFQSSANNLVANDTNATQDVFVRDYSDPATPITSLVSVNSAGSGSGSGNSHNLAMSADGSVVVFQSESGNLVTGDHNGLTDVFARDLLENQTTLISQATIPSESTGGVMDTRNTLSADGRYLVFLSNASNLVSGLTINGQNVYRRDQLTGEVQLVSMNAAGTGSGNNHAYQPSISADGMVVAFTSQSSNLVANDTNGITQDVFIRDFSDPGNPVTRLVSINAAGTGSGNYDSYEPSLSANGKVVAFSSSASDLVANDIYGTGQDVFIRDYSDPDNPVTRLVSVNYYDGNGSDGGGFTPIVSANGKVVAFSSYAYDLTNNDWNGNLDLFVRDFSDPDNPVTRLVTAAVSGSSSTSYNDYSYEPVLSADGKVVAFTSYAYDLVNNDTNWSSLDVFVRDFSDPDSPVTRLVSINSTGDGSGNSESYRPAISADGKIVAFDSYASDLVDNDTNGNSDVFVRDFSDPDNPVTRLVSVNPAGTGSNNYSFQPVISANGKVVAFTSYATDLTPNDFNGSIADVFVRDFSDPANPVTRLVSITSTGDVGGNSASSEPRISANGNVVAFHSSASNLVPGDLNATTDVFVTTFDVSPPAVSAPDLAAASDSGLHNDDNITNLTSLTISGTAEAGSTVELLEDGSPLASVVATDGTWSFTRTFAEGTHTLQARATDASNNSATSVDLVVIVDVTAPTINAVRDTVANANGWNNTDVGASYAASDGLSGLADPATGSHTFSAEGAGQSHTFTVTDLAGNSASSMISGVNIDKTAPTINATRDTAANANGWNNTDVGVSYAASDGLSGLADPASGSHTFSAEGAGQSHTFTVTDLAGNSASSTISDVNIDKTAPTINAVRDTAANANGWNNTDVGASYAASDGLSGLADPASGSHTFSAEGAGQSHTFTVTDLAGNSASGTISDVNIDKTAPTISAVRDTAANANGWNNTDVGASYAASDGLSGLADPATGSHTFSAEGAGQSHTFTVTDLAGNSASSTISGVNIDKTAPTINAVRTTAANGYGWNNTNVEANYIASDGLSGLVSAVAGSHTFTAEGAGQSHTFLVTDKAGNTAGGTISDVNIDKTAPTINAVRTTAANGYGWNNTNVEANYTASDGLSGLVSAVAGSHTFTAEGAGQSHTFTVTDKAGNTADGTISDVNIDKTAPTINAARTTAANGYGWNNTNVEANYTASDGLSGLVSAVGGSHTFTAEGAGQSHTFLVTDKAGNTAGGTISDVNIDKTAPTINAVRDTAANANGWNNSDVGASYAASDALSGLIDPPNGNYTFTAEGAGQSHTFTVTDLAGNSTSSTISGVNIDKTAASISLLPVSGSYLPGANFTWSVVDNLALGPISVKIDGVEVSTDASGSLPMPIGSHSVQIAAVDLAGNVSNETRTYVTTGAALTGTELVVIGTAGNDNIQLATNAQGKVVVTLNGVTSGPFDVGTGKVVAYGLDGNDTIRADSLQQPARIFGGNGNDSLYGGANDDALFGDDGDDTLYGGGAPGRDLLVGGLGADSLTGNTSILISGNLTHESNKAAIDAILATWGNRTLSYVARVSQLQAGVGPLLVRLDATSVLGDTSVDRLELTTGVDWYFATLPQDQLLAPARPRPPIGSPR